MSLLALIGMEYIADVSLISSTHSIVSLCSDAKEALLFALLAYLCVKGIRGSIPSCTFAKDSRVLGKIVPGANFHSVVLNSV
jgi:1,6-anhydro-N-acetylmuramate kinase